MKTQPMNVFEQEKRAKEIKASIADSKAMAPLIKEMYEVSATGYAEERQAYIVAGFSSDEAFQMVLARMGRK